MADIEESKSKEKVDEPKKIPEPEKSLYDESVPMKALEEEKQEKQEKPEKQAVFKKKQETRFVSRIIFLIVFRVAKNLK